MNTKQFLNQAFYLNGLIEANNLELARLEALAQSVCSPDLSKERVQTSMKDDKVGETVVLIVELQNDIQADINKLIQVKRDVRRVINEISDSKLKLILQERYLNFKKWEEISLIIGCSFRWVVKLHSEALREAEKIIFATS